MGAERRRPRAANSPLSTASTVVRAGGRQPVPIDCNPLRKQAVTSCSLLWSVSWGDLLGGPSHHLGAFWLPGDCAPFHALLPMHPFHAPSAATNIDDYDGPAARTPWFPPVSVEKKLEVLNDFDPRIVGNGSFLFDVDLAKSLAQSIISNEDIDGDFEMKFIKLYCRVVDDYNRFVSEFNRSL